MSEEFFGLSGFSVKVVDVAVCSNGIPTEVNFFTITRK
jgi:hypothetical protein